MRCYLDTNILVFILFKETHSINRIVADILDDYANTFLASSVAVRELIFLFKAGKLKSNLYNTVDDMLAEIKKLDIDIIPFNNHHLQVYSKLTIPEKHRDMNDHAIISQAMSDKIALISSDSEFKFYTNQGLNFIFNKR